MNGYVSEIYASRQGEGPYTGENQIFVRLAGCPLRCDYCDTPGSLSAKASHLRALQDVLGEIEDLCKLEKINTVSITGGEPLSQREFIEGLSRELNLRGQRVYLETAGVHGDVLSRIVQWVDVIAMDIKLPSATGIENWAKHERFLEIGASKAFVKVVLEAHSKISELEKVLALLKKYPPAGPLIFQPVERGGGVFEPPNEEKIQDFLQRALKVIPDVRVMRQMHKEWAVR